MCWASKAQFVDHNRIAAEEDADYSQHKGKTATTCQTQTQTQTQTNGWSEPNPFLLRHAVLLNSN